MAEASRRSTREGDSLQRYRAIFESAVDFAIIASDRDGLVTDWNSGAETVFGWSAGEMLGQPADRFFTPEDRADGCVDAEMLGALQNGRASDERWHLRKDGSRFWANGEMMPLRDPNGEHLGFLKIVRDETEKHLAVEEQRADREFMRSVLAASDDCIKVLDLDANLLFMSEGGQRVMEVEDFETIRGCPWPDFWHGDLNAEARAAVASARAGRSAQFRGPASTVAGSPRWWEVRLSPILGRDGKPEKLLSISRDVTQTTTAEQALREGEARWRGLFEKLREGFILGELVRDGDGHVTDWRYLDINPAWSSLVGVSEDDARGRTIREVFPSIEDAWVDEMAAVVAEGAPTVFTRQVGTIARWYEGRAFPLGGDRFGVIFLEVTERIGAERRRDALLGLDDRFRNLSEADDLADAACAALGTSLGVELVGYGLVDPVAETFTVERDWTAGSALSLAGTLNFRDFGSYIDDLKRGTTVVIEDARTDGRTSAFAAALEARHARAFVNTPLFERGGFVALLYVSTGEARRWTVEDLDFIREVAGRTRVATARLIAEAERRAAEADLRLVLNALPLMVAFVDRSLTYRVANVGYRDWFDLDPDQVLGRRIPDLLSPEGFAARKPFIECALAGTPARFDLTWPWPDGRRRVAEIQYVPRHASDGAVDGFYVFVQAVTAQRDAEALLADEKVTLAREVVERTVERDRLWETTNDLMGTVGFDGYVKSVNPAWTAALGWTEAEILSRPFIDLVAPGDQDETADAVRRLAGGETVSGFVDRVHTQAGETRVVMWNAVPDPDRATFHIIGRDLTEQHQTEEALRQSQKMEAVGQLTGGIAHDFNNLLTGITGALELIERRIAQGRLNDVGRFAGLAQASAKRAAALTHRLLAFSRRQTLDPRATDVNRLIADIEEMIRRTVGPAVHVEAVKAAGLWPTLVDSNQLENALLNLCINARDAMPEGGRLTIETANRWIDQRTARDRDLPSGQYVSLSVSDTGTGMPPEVIAKAFEPFFTTKPLGQGTGLGLSMIYGFARQSGGQARIYSEVDQGTTVCLYLPRHLGEAESAEPVPEADAAPHAEAGETVLIVDDEIGIRVLVVELLRDLGYAAIEAADGASGLKVLQSDARVDLLVTDVGLPGGMNGRHLADAARVWRPDLKVLFITGYAENAAVGNGHLAPGMHVMTKPFALEALASRMRELIAGDGGRAPSS